MTNKFAFLLIAASIGALEANDVGGVPDFNANETTSIKGEGVRKGHKAIKSRKGDDKAYTATLGGLPDFEANETMSIKGEGVGKGDKSIVAEKGGMPEFDISGSAMCFGVASGPTNKYYDGTDQAKFINRNLKSTKKTNKDASSLGLIAGDANVAFSAKGTLDNGLEYGAKLNLQAVKDDTGIKEMFIFFKNNLGSLHIGNKLGPDALYNVGAQSLIGGTEGIDGALFAQIDPATGSLIPCGPIGFSNRATKFIYETPNWSGLTLSLSYTPDTKHHGNKGKNRSIGDSSNGNNTGTFIKGDNDKERPSGKNNICLGARFEHDFGNGIINQSAAYFLTEEGQKIKTTAYTSPIFVLSPAETREIELNGARAFGISNTIKLNNFSLSVGYFNSGKGRLPKKSEFKDDNIIFPAFMSNSEGNAGHSFNMGLRYDWKQWAFALVGHRATRKVTKDQKAVSYITSFTVDWLVRPGLKVFSEIDYIKSKSCPYACALYNLNHKNKDAVIDQSGVIFTIGAKILF